MQTSLLSDITDRLASISDTPALDASVLMAHILNVPRTRVLAHPKLVLTTEQRKQLDASLERLERREPLPYVLGRWEFFGLEFEVTPEVLIPRPETELMVQRALAWLQQSPGRVSVADIGTGSGAIAVSIAVSLPEVRVLATDISPGALDVARRNAAKFSVAHQIDFVQCDLLPRREGREATRGLDLICANLPYIPTDTLHALPIFGHEPTLALDGGADGLEPARRLLDIGPEWLTPGGMLLLELEATRARDARNLACALFPTGKIHLHKDLAGRDRLLEITI